MKLTIKNNKNKKAAFRINISSKTSIHFYPDFIEIDQWNRGLKPVSFDVNTQTLVITSNAVK